MQTFEIILIAVALSIDAFAVSLAASAAGRIRGSRATFRIAFHFGLFQFLMPVLGWAAGAELEPLIKSVDHWMAFALLTVVGIRMIRAARAAGASVSPEDPSRGMTLLALSTAVSVDALAVGLSLGMLRMDIWTPSAIIGIITAVVSLAGVKLGTKISDRFGRITEMIGGIILILVGLRIVLSHIFGV